MADAMKGVTTALTKMNQKMNLPGLQKIMQEFMKENERAEITQEMIGDTIDDAMAEDGTAEEEDNLVNQVFDELGISALGAVPAAPNQVSATAAPQQEEEVSDKPGEVLFHFHRVSQLPQLVVQTQFWPALNPD